MHISFREVFPVAYVLPRLCLLDRDRGSHRSEVVQRCHRLLEYRLEVLRAACSECLVGDSAPRSNQV